MKPNWKILQAMQYCPYKAWQINRDPDSELETPQLSSAKISAIDKIALTAHAFFLSEEKGEKVRHLNILKGKDNLSIQIKPSLKAEKLLADTKRILDSDAPVFYKNKHCPECQFWETCRQKLKDKDCISLLGSISPKIIERYHKKGIFTVLQLSHLFRPRRRSRRKPRIASNYLWELKALAIREQKTYVMYTPDIEDISEAIYLDFEGLPDERFIYLIGGIVHFANKPNETFSFWADSRENEKEIFRNLFRLLNQYPDLPIYHYGSYETKSLNTVVQRYGSPFKQEFIHLQKRMANLLSYLRTSVYPPTYSNGLKEVANFLRYNWTGNIDGLQSITLRKQWEETNDPDIKEQLTRYNHEDCKALQIVNNWLHDLTVNANPDNTHAVASMKKLSPYKFQANPNFGEDYDIISKAAYFDYQQTKIYWRNKRTAPPLSKALGKESGIHPGKGVMGWQPGKANEVVTAKPLHKCPGCGSSKVYNLKTTMRSFKQTDIKFTASGVLRHVIEFKSTQGKCGTCKMKYNNAILKRMRYGNNLMALITQMYIIYHISSNMIAKMIMDQYHIWISPMYVVDRKYKWWLQWQPEVDYLWKIILKSSVIHIDETTVKLSKDTGYVWVFATSHTVYYHFTLTRETEFLKEWMKDYKGVIITDFFPGYDTLKLQRQKCLVHLIRDFNDDLHKNPFDEGYKNLMDAFSKLLVKIIATIDRYGLSRRHLQKHLGDTEEFYKSYLSIEYKGELSIKYSKRLKKHWDELWVFLKHDDIPWNNNNAEAAIKAFAQHRHNVNGRVREGKLLEYLKMLSLAQTCRYRKIPFLEFLRRKAGLWENVPPEYLPSFLPYSQARLYSHRLKFTRKREWNEWIKSGKRPSFIPGSPNSTYKKTRWSDWHDWLGFKFLPFEKARTYMRRLGLKNRDEYWAWLKSDKRPATIPYSPEKEYKHTGWIDLGDWLGTGNTGRQRKKRMTYEQAKTYIQALGIKTQHEFFAWRKTDQRPETMPPDPNKVYFEFEGWGEFLGTGRIANQNKKYRSYEEAKIFLKPLRITSGKHFRKLCAIGIIPKDIPNSPYAFYSKQKSWISFPDFFGK